MIQFDIHEGPGAEEREHTGEGEGAGQHIAQHALMAEQGSEVTQRGTQMEFLPSLFRQRLFNKERHQQ
ncbi:hypothetical protein D3C78_1577430 [compost metagenome]